MFTIKSKIRREREREREKEGGWLGQRERDIEGVKKSGPMDIHILSTDKAKKWREREREDLKERCFEREMIGKRDDLKEI